MNTVVIYHRSDFDGILSGAICRHFLTLKGVSPLLIGWEYGDEVPDVPRDAELYIVDLAVPELMDHPRLVWIDHHKSSIEKYGERFGYQLDGVAACRLCWQWFSHSIKALTLWSYVNRQVVEPRLVRLVGEYDVWDKRDPDAEALQEGLRLHRFNVEADPLQQDLRVRRMIQDGERILEYKRITNAGLVKDRAYHLENWQHLRWLVLNHSAGNSQTFVGHPDIDKVDGLILWRYDGAKASVSLYCSPKSQGKLDLSTIAKRYGGGGHACACGFTTDPVRALVMFSPQAQRCRKCGCTDYDACITDGVACHWVDNDLCSRCVE